MNMNSFELSLRTGLRRARLPLLLLGCLLFMTACEKTVSGPEESSPAADWPVSTPLEQGLNPDLLDQAAAEAENLDYIRSMLVVRNGYLVAEHYFHGFDTNQTASVQSVTKSVVSALVGIALRDGYVDSVHQKILDFFPEYSPDGLSDSRKADITIHHLLTMASGFAADSVLNPYFFYSTDWIATAMEVDLVSDPGEAFHYSSYAVHLLSALLSRASGMPVLDFARQKLFQHIAVEGEFWLLDPQGIPFGGGGLYLTTREMANFGALYLEEGLRYGKQVLPMEWVETSLEPHREELGEWGVLENMGYGYLWWSGTLGGHSARLAIGYGGQFIILFPALEMMVVVRSDPSSQSEESDAQERGVMELVTLYILPALEEDS
jgi:CubicO group peptidase (beta-lactamase class C family)